MAVENLITRAWKRYGKIEYVLLLLMSMEFMGVHHYVLLVLFIYLLFKGRIVSSFCKTDLFLVFIWGCLYWMFVGRNHLWSELQVPSWLVAFLVGASLCKDRQSFFDVLLVLALGYALEGLLTVTLSEGMDSMINIGGDLSNVDRSVDSFWGKGITRSFSALNVSYYLFSALLVYIFFSNKNSLLIKGIAISFGLSFVLVAFRIAMRSSLLFNPLIFVLSYIGMATKRGRIFNLILFVVLAFALIYFSGIFELFSDSYLFYRLDTQDDGGFAHNARFALQGRFWSLWYLYPWGDMHDQIRFFFHNTWMDTYAFSGIISAFFFLVLTIRWVVNALYVFKREDALGRSLIAGLFAAFYLPFCMDPMLQAAPAFMCFYILIFGMLSKRRYFLSKENIINSRAVSLIY